MTQPALSMQIRDLETDPRRRPGRAAAGRCDADRCRREIARRAEDVLTASRDLVDFARHRGGLLTGRLTLGVIPSLAPYCCRRFCRLLQTPASRNCGSNCARPRPATGRGYRARRARRRDAGAAGGRARHRYDCRCSTIRSCWRCRPSDPREENARVAARRYRSKPADPARGRPLPARSGAGVLRDRGAGPRRRRRRDRVRRDQSRPP